MDMKRARVVLADDYEPAHEVYCKLLGPEVEVVAAVSDCEAAMQAAQAHAPDLMLLDIEMGAIGGFALARWLKKNLPGIKIVFLTLHAEPAYMNEAAGIGAEGYVVKRNAVAELLKTVRTVLAGSRTSPVGAVRDCACGAPRDFQSCE
jgi:DNA-binding NarL/FixJ family response regulator